MKTSEFSSLDLVRRLLTFHLLRRSLHCPKVSFALSRAGLNNDTKSYEIKIAL